MEPICYIVGACPPGEIRFAPGRPAFVIAADKGLVHLEAQGIRPDLIVGDFDSLGQVPAGDNILRHPVEKDDTDTMLAVKTALDRGMGTIVFYGCLGDRPIQPLLFGADLACIAEHHAQSDNCHFPKFAFPVISAPDTAIYQCDHFLLFLLVHLIKFFKHILLSRI